MKKFRLLLICGFAMLLMASCNTYKHQMISPNNFVEYHAEDFELSDAVTGEATVVRVLGIDWEHAFGTEEIGGVIPYIGMMLPNGSNYAVYNLMKKNPGYDVMIYPQVESHRHAPILGTDLYSKTTYKVTARLGKLKK